MRKLLLRAALAFAPFIVFAGCAQEQAASKPDFFSESDAVASVQALAETPLACGPTFDKAYQLRTIPANGDKADLTLYGITTRAWPQQLLHFRVSLPSGTNADNLVVRGPGTPGAIITRQVDICRTEANGVRIARLTFFADHPGGGADVIYTAGFESGAMPPNPSGLGKTVASGYVELSNEFLTVRTQPLGEQTFPSTALTGAQAPITRFTLSDNAVVQPSSFDGTKRKLTSIETFWGADGPVFKELLLAYEFAPIELGGQPGYWRVAIRVVRGIPMVLVEEEYDFGTEEPETQVDQWVLDIGQGWNPTRLTATYGKFTPFEGTDTVIYGDPETHAVESRVLTSTAVNFSSLTPFLAGGSEHFWSGVHDNGSKFAGIVPLFGGAWRRYPKIAAEYSTGHAVVRLQLGITTPKEPSYQLSTAGDDIDLPRSTARRQWGLVLGTPKNNTELFNLRGRYGSLSMNDIKEWHLKWGDLETLTYDRYPMALLTPALAEAAHDAYGSAAPEVKAALSRFYFATHDSTKAEQARNHFNAQLIGNGNGRTGYINLGGYFGNLLPPTSGPYTTFMPIVHYRVAESALPELIARAEDYLSWPGPVNPTTEEADDYFDDRILMLQRLAMLAHLISHPEFAPVTSGAHQGNPNMPLNRLGALPVLMAMLGDHPLKEDVYKISAKYFQTMSESYLSTGGSFRESTPTYQNAGLPFIQYALLGLERMKNAYPPIAMPIDIEPYSLLENATRFQPGTLTPVVDRYGIRVWEPFGQTGIEPINSPLVTAAIYEARGQGQDYERAQALKAWQLSGSICNEKATQQASCMMAAYAAVYGQAETDEIELGSRFMPGMGVSFRGRPNTAQESFVLLSGSYNASHMNPAEPGSFAFHTAGDELIGFPDNGYISGQTSWNQSWGAPWSGIRELSKWVSRTGEWTDTGFTELSDYALYQTSLQRTGYGSGAWVRQAMLIKGEESSEYDYMMFRDARPFRGSPQAPDVISDIHLATRLPASRWSASGTSIDLSGQHGGWLRFTALDPVNGSATSADGVSYPVEEKPLCELRIRGAATVQSVIESINANPLAPCSPTRPNVAHSAIDFEFPSPTPPATLPTNATWMLQSSDGAPSTPLTATKLVDNEGDAVFRISHGSLGTDYVFMSDTWLDWNGAVETNTPLSFKGYAGVVRVRGSENVELALNAGLSISFGTHSLTGDGPLFCRTTRSSSAPCTDSTPAPSFDIPSVSGAVDELSPDVDLITSGTVRQYRVKNDDGKPVRFAVDRLVVDGIVEGAITITPYHTNFTVLRGGGLFRAEDKVIVGAGPFAVDSRPDVITGQTEGRPRALWVDGFHAPSSLEVDGVKVTHQEIDQVFLTSVGLIEGTHEFKIERTDNRLSTLPHPNYTLDRITGRIPTPPRTAPSGALTFTGFGDFSDSACWTPRPPTTGDTVFIPSTSGVAISQDTPQLAGMIVDGSVTFNSATAKLRATEVEVCGTVTHMPNQATSAVGGLWPVNARVSIEATNFKLCATGRIDVVGKGYQAPIVRSGPGYGPGHGSCKAVTSEPFRDISGCTGAGHAGYGGGHSLRGADVFLPGGPYDDSQHPNQPGSAGGSNLWSSYGGTGGGVVRIVATGRATIDGAIKADGQAPRSLGGNNLTNSGGGSGGAIEISCNELVGTGLMSANGGAPTGVEGGGGSGGMIAVHYVNLPTPLATLRISAAAGLIPAPAHKDGDGALGTVYVSDSRFYPPATVTDSASVLVGNSQPIERTSFTVSDLLVQLPSLRVNGALAVHGTKGKLILGGDTWVNSVEVDTNARLELLAPATPRTEEEGPCPSVRFQTVLRVAGALNVRSGSTFTPRSDPYCGASPQILAQSVLVESNAAISADAAGYGSTRPSDAIVYDTGAGEGTGPGGGAYYSTYPVQGSGGSYGGRGGGTSDRPVNPAATYGSKLAPDQPGSAGGASSLVMYRGGAGGGLVHMQVAGTAQINGLLTANGEDQIAFTPPTNGASGGGGSGGGIYLVCNTLSGGGAIHAKGGAPQMDGGGGGGGRIAIYRQTSSWTGEALYTGEGTTAPPAVAGGPVVLGNSKAGEAGSVEIGTTPPMGTGPVSIFGGELIAYFRSDSGVMRDANGLVQTWLDLSMNGNHVLQNTAASRPTYVATGRHPALAFDDTSPTQWLENAAVANGLTPSTGYYLWAVRRVTPGAEGSNLCVVGARYSNGVGAFTIGTLQRPIDTTIWVNNPAVTLRAVAFDPGIPVGEWHYNEAYFTATGLAGALDGTVIANGGVSPHAPAGTLQRIDIGRNGPGSNTVFHGELYELGVTRVTPSAAQLAVMRTYLDERYIGELPQGTITSPAANATFSAGATVAIAAQAAAHYRSDVTRVEFYRGSTLIDSDTTAPYSINWTSVPAGSYVLSARVVGTDSLIGTSAGVPIVVNP